MLHAMFCGGEHATSHVLRQRTCHVRCSALENVPHAMFCAREHATCDVQRYRTCHMRCSAPENMPHAMFCAREHATLAVLRQRTCHMRCSALENMPHALFWAREHATCDVLNSYFSGNVHDVPRLCRDCHRTKLCRSYINTEIIQKHELFYTKKIEIRLFLNQHIFTKTSQ